MYWIEKNNLPNGFYDVLEQIKTENPNIIFSNSNIPMDLCCSVFRVYHQNGLDKFLAGGLDYTISKWYISANFKKHKQIYIMNENLFNRLKTTTGIDNIDSNIVRNLPFPNFYIDLGRCKLFLNDIEQITGAFIGLDKATVDGVQIENITVVICVNNRDFIPLAFEIGKNFCEVTKHIPDCQNRDSGKVKSVFKNILQIVLYMCVATADIKKMSKKTKSNKKYSQPTISEIGYRIGRTIGENAKRYQYDDAGETEHTGVKYAPHFRRPHWATYHVGKGRERVELRWIDIIFVNGNEDDDDILPTVHKMK